MIKQSNFNAIRISHYPNDAFFYLLCDHLGVYVVDKANIETVYVDRLESMVERDKNHACILMWSLGTRHNHHFRLKEGWLSMTHVKPEPGLTCVDGGQATRAGSDATRAPCARGSRPGIRRAPYTTSRPSTGTFLWPRSITERLSLPPVLTGMSLLL
jgi:beta-galactosidase/beta-glucuronidase